MKIPRLTCTTPYGTFARGTWRPYTHVLVGIRADGTGVDLSWHGTEHLARAQRTYWNQSPVGRSTTAPAIFEIFPVDATTAEGK